MTFPKLLLKITFAILLFVAFLLAPTVSFAQINLSDGLVGYWSFDEGSGQVAVDASVNGNDLNLGVNTIADALDPDWVSGKVGSGLHFRSSGSQAVTNAIFTPPEDGTVSFWMRAGGTQSDKRRPFGLADDWEVLHQRNTGVLSMSFQRAGSNPDLVTQTAFPTDIWTHIAISYKTTADDDSFYVYVNGALESSGTSDLVPANTATLTFGTRTGSSNYFEGDLDEVRVYDRLLSASEVFILANPNNNIADLSLTLSIDSPAPDSGDVINLSLQVCNAGPDSSQNALVSGFLHPSFTVQSFSMTRGVFQGTDWLIRALPADSCATYSMDILLTASGIVDAEAQVVSADEPDPDSTPNDDMGDEYDVISFTVGSSSGGSSSGLESNGNMAIALGQRMFTQRFGDRNNQNLANKKASSNAVFAVNRNAAIAAKPGFRSGFYTADLADVIPATGPQGTPATSVTPRDLIDITNAESIISVDYTRDDNRRLGAIFGVTTPTGSLYEHTKVVCDRLIGGRLHQVEIVSINGREFVLNQLRHLDGSLDYAISFVAHRQGTNYVIDSRFTQKQYDLTIASDDVVTFQVWSVAAQYTKQIVADMLEKMETQGTVTYLNDAIETPEVYIRSGYYDAGNLYLTMINPGPAHNISLEGTLSKVEEGVREVFTTNVYVPEARNGNEVHVVVPTGFVFDASLAMYDAEGNGFDQLFFSDGVWGYNTDEEGATISSFSTAANAIQEPDGSTYPIARVAHLEGEAQSWATLYRFLRAGGQPQDLTHFNNLSFRASGNSGTGKIEIVLVKQSISNFEDQARVIIDLPADSELGVFVLDFDDFKANFDASDITMIAFNPIGSGNASEAFLLDIIDAKFAGGAVTTANENDTSIPTAFGLDQSYPNPFNPQTTIAYQLSQASHVTLHVYDVAGRRIKTLVNHNQPSGNYQVQFNGEELASGLYVYRIDILGSDGERFTQTRKMMLIK